MSALPRGWVDTTLGEICEINPSLPDRILGDNELCSFVPMASVEQETGRIDPSKTRSFGELRRRSYRHFREGDVVVAKITPSMENGKAAVAGGLINGWGFGSTEFHVLRPYPAVDPWFVMHYVLRAPFRSDAARHMTGTAGQMRVPASYLGSARIPLPPLAEQRRIVAAIEEQFSRLDAAEGLLRRARENVKHIRGSVLSPAAASRHPTAPLRSLLREPLRNGHSSKAASGADGIRTLTLTAVTKADFSDQNTKLTSADPNRVKDLWLEPGDVFIERSNTPELVGTAALYRGPREWAIFPDLLIRVRVSEALLPEFLQIVLKSKPVRRYFRGSAQGIAGSMPKIDQSTVEGLEVPVPPLDEQQRIVAEVERHLSVVDAISAAIDAALRRAAALRRSILEQAFTGKLVPQDPSDEPASALLERITCERAGAEPKRRKTATSRRAS